MTRTTSGGTAQLSDGTWVNMGMLTPVEAEEEPDVKAAAKSAIAKAKAKAQVKEEN